MEISIFDIPLLGDEIAQYLSPNNLTCCTLVCKSWFHCFSPILWRHVQFSIFRIITPEQLSGLVRHQSHVRSILGFDLEKATIPKDSWSFPNLRSVEFRQGGWCHDQIQNHVLGLVSGTPWLRNLKITLWLNCESKSTRKQLIQTLTSHSTLKELDLSVRSASDSMSILSIIQACTRLESLRLCLENKSTISLFSEVLDVAELHEEGDEDEDEDEKRSNDDAGSEEGDSALINNVVKMRKTGLRELSVCLPPASHGPSTLKSLLRQCPRLETLYLEHLEDARAIQEITNVLQGGRCPRLKNLRLGRVGKYEDSDEIVTLLLRSLKTRRISSTSGTSSSNGIKNNNDDSNDDGYNGRGGLQSFAVVDGEYQDAIFRKKYILSLVRYHAKTLTAIDFSMHPLKIHYFVHLVSGLPNLRTVLSKVLLKPRSEDESDLDQVFKKDWACLGVTHLDLDLSQACKIKSVEDPSWKGSVADRCISYIFPQIGRITELKEWSLGGKVDLLSLDDGYLELLAGLKRLDTLRLNRWSDYRMGAKEADWMLENWPQLRRIELFHQVMPEELPESEQLALQLFVSRLNSEKPWLRIS